MVAYLLFTAHMLASDTIKPPLSYKVGFYDGQRGVATCPMRSHAEHGGTLLQTAHAKCGKYMSVAGGRSIRHDCGDERERCEDCRSKTGC